MRNLADIAKPVQLIAPISMTATVTGTGQSVIAGSQQDAVAIVSLGAVSGAPSATSVIVTIEESDAVGGTYTTNATFATATAGGQVGTKEITIKPTKPFLRAVVTIAFTGGTTPAIVAGVDLLVRKIVATDSNEVALA